MYKRCEKCKITFHNEERSRCLYCDAILMSVSQDKDVNPLEVTGEDLGSLIELVVSNRAQFGHLGMQYVIGNYFKTRSFRFMYYFSRNEYRIGPKFKRFWVQPLNIGSILTLPWIVIDFLDSVFMRVFYRGHCPVCNWKYPSLTAEEAPLPPEKREYNIEYTRLVEDILSGKITTTEDTFRKLAMDKLKEGKRSAYFDLCSRKNKQDVVLDIATVWVSIMFITYVLVVVLLPLMVELTETIIEYS